MIRGGDGKMKGKRSRRPSKGRQLTGWPMYWFDGHKLATSINGYIQTIYMHQGPIIVQWSAAEDHTKW